MGLVTGAVRDHAEKEVADLRAELRALLEKAADVSREIAMVEMHAMLGAQYASSEAKVSGKTPVPPAPPRGKPAESKEPSA